MSGVRSPTATNKLPPFIPFKIICHSQNLKMESQLISISKRATCPDCSKPVSLCLCIRLKTRNLDNNIHVTILQHYLEKRHPLNSARIARLGLKNVDVFNVTDVNFDALFQISLLECTPCVCGNASESFESPRINEPFMSVTVGKSGKITRVSHHWKLLDDSESPEIEYLINSPETVKYLAGGFTAKKLQKKEITGSLELEQFEEFEIRVPPGTALLFPSENAVAVEDIDFKVKNLIILDGTWSKAKRMYLENPWLKILPSVRLDVEKTSLFSEVRRQPKPGYLSTIESIVYALEALGETDNLSGLNNLLEVFESMVQDQRRFKDENMIKPSST